MLQRTAGAGSRVFYLEINKMADSQNIELAATVRPRSGKGAARQARREGRVPGVIYGDKQPAETISLEYNELFKQFMKGHFTSTLIHLDIEGRKVPVLPRDVQLDPIKDIPVHVDFQRVSEESRVRVDVAVHFINEGLSPGLKRGGVLNIVRHEIEVMAPAHAIPAYFEVDLEGLEIGRSVHISAVKLPEGVRPTITNRDFTICTIAGAVRQEEEAPAPGQAAAAEGAAAGDAKAVDAKAAPDAKKK